MDSRRQSGPRGILVGRDEELARIGEALQAGTAGGMWVVQMVGEPGIGKSRLLAELQTRAERRGYLVLDGRAAEFEQDAPFGLIVDALNDYLGSLEPTFLRQLDADTTSELTSVFPSLSWLAGEGSRQRVDGERYRAHYAIRALLEALSRRQPLALALDDVHWADEASIEVIAHLLRRFRGSLLGAFAFRQAPMQLAAALDGAVRAGSGSRLELAPLTPEEARVVIDPAVDPATRAAIYRESGGNPFYLEQLARAGNRNALDLDAVEGGAASEWTPPPAVLAAIRDELARLSDETRLVLESAAVAGESFDPELVGAIAGGCDPVPLAALDELLGADLIRPADSPRRFRFRHPIVRRAVYDGMGGAWRLGAHARAAAAVVATGGPAAAAAHHIERSALAGDESSLEVLIDAARSVSSRAPLTAGRWLLAALRLLPLSAAAGRRLELLREAAGVLAQAGAYEQSLTALLEALALLPPSRTGERVDIIVRIARAKRESGLPVQSRELIEQTLGSLERTDSREALTLRLELALDCYVEGEFARMHQLAAAVMPSARQGKDLLMSALAAAITSISDVSRDRVGRALAELEEARATFATMNDELLAQRVDLAGFVGLAAVRLERHDEALAHVQRGIEVSRASGQGAVIPGLLSLKASALLLAGRVTEAVQVAETAADAALLSGNEQLTIWALEAVSLASVWAGDTRRALDAAREAITRSERVGQTFLSGLSQLRLAAALHAAGDAAGARDAIQAFASGPAARLLDLNGGHGWELLTRVHLELGNLEDAEAAATAAEATASATPLPQRAATNGIARAAVLLARGDTDSSRAASIAAAEHAKSAGNPLLLARARGLAGRALAATGERKRAITELADAHVALLACGAAKEADAVARELRRLGHRVARQPHRNLGGVGLAALSHRESEVAMHVATGKTNREVAEILFVSEKTIESHLARIYEKLGVHSRTALAAIIARAAEREPPRRRE